MNSNTIEQRAILTGALVSMLMAVAGWTAYYYSGSQALLLDGNFSLIGAIATLVGLKIAKIKANKTTTFPFGQYVFESLYSLLIGLLTLGLIISASIENGLKIFSYIEGERFEAINTSIIGIYTIAMMLLCFGLTWLFLYCNKKIGNSSTMLSAYTVQSFIDGAMSAGAGLSLVGMSLIPTASQWGFLTQIGDSIVVIALCLLVIYQPIKLIRSSFIEMSGGVLQDEETKNSIRDIINKHIDLESLDELFISKTGSSFLVIAFVGRIYLEEAGIEKTFELKELIATQLKDKYEHSTFEMALSGQQA
ncbi:cation transporter [Agaribacterium haliotis]|uniref:cation transporter n=1 Tax=Agaribacterium haliotis TaxID=2013869 RepID=UPI000BB56D6D|nr:cation transporter [Agaribacterium haliotis]